MARSHYLRVWVRPSHEVSYTNYVTEPNNGTRWTLHDKRRIYDSSWVTLDLADVSQPSGSRYEHHVVTLKPAVLIVLLDELKQHILMTRRHRIVHDRWSWEVPGGLIEPGEEPREAAFRELREETGLVASRMRLMFSYEPMIGNVRSAHHVFFAENVEEAQEPTELNEGSFRWLALSEARDKILNNQIVAVGPLAAILFLLQFGAPST